MKTPEAMSILAAEILGWTRTEHERGDCQIDIRYVNKDGRCIINLPAFHSDANAALQLVKWIKTSGPWPLFLVWNSDTGTASFCRNDGGEPTAIGTATDSTFQLAVLVAFLRANGKEIE